MLAQCTGFLEHSDLHFSEIAACFLICLDQLSQRDRAGETSRTPTDEKNIHWDCFSVGLVGENQPIDRKRSLMDAW